MVLFDRLICLKTGALSGVLPFGSKIIDWLDCQKGFSLDLKRRGVVIIERIVVGAVLVRRLSAAPRSYDRCDVGSASSLHAAHQLSIYFFDCAQCFDAGDRE